MCSCDHALVGWFVCSVVDRLCVCGQTIIAALDGELLGDEAPLQDRGGGHRSPRIHAARAAALSPRRRSSNNNNNDDDGNNHGDQDNSVAAAGCTEEFLEFHNRNCPAYVRACARACVHDCIACALSYSVFLVRSLTARQVPASINTPIQLSIHTQTHTHARTHTPPTQASLRRFCLIEGLDPVLAAAGVRQHEIVMPSLTACVLCTCSY